ncbi:protein of unknown function [Actinopolyspora xinjiangensis]|uniref:DUF4307 domain-containing protein n=1 Tax=Actinopolyspora xinjiangensis TaxID=405564 RepID=A0A1H0QN43_9ACTN|nr:DUF4307 domain-containing protein [Actinopolyspora xinjiangensis]SDP18754.1 protein of unknown function [Actinopolyspora xinjiangensis]
MTSSPEGGSPGRGSGIPEGRYGARGSGRGGRWPAWPAIALVIVLGVALSVLAYRNFGSAPIEGKASRFDIRGENSVHITLEVRRDEPARPAECVVRSRGVSGKEAGRKEVYIPPGETTTYRETVLTTSESPVTGEVFGCSYDVPNYLRDRTRPSG